MAGTYKATGTVKDSLGDTGAWSFALTVVATKLFQLAPASARVTTGKARTDQIEVAGAHGAVTYVESAGKPDLTVTTGGVISAPASLVAGTYKAAGTAEDRLGDAGAWSFTLTVVATKLVQLLPARARTMTGKAFTDQLEVSGTHGAIAYIQSTGAPHLKISSSGRVSAGAGLAAGTYEATGIVRDSLGDTGAWRFALTSRGHRANPDPPGQRPRSRPARHSTASSRSRVRT